MSPNAGEKDLTQAYGQFKSEALNVDPKYQPDSVNTDGWTATLNAWLTLFPSVTMILCFLHSFHQDPQLWQKTGGCTTSNSVPKFGKSIIVSLRMSSIPK